MSEINNSQSLFCENVFYHGSAQAGITHLEPHSKLHGEDKTVVYLTDNVPYALFYIWDERITGCADKHVTGVVQNGIAYYEEQFPNQLEAFYNGAAGYLYTFSAPDDIRRMENRHGIFYSEKTVEVAEAIYVPNVYEAMLCEEAAGRLRVLRYNERSQKRQEELIDLLAETITKNDFFCNDSIKATFMKKFFVKAWERAEKQRTQH